MYVIHNYFINLEYHSIVLRDSTRLFARDYTSTVHARALIDCII